MSRLGVAVLQALSRSPDATDYVNAAYEARHVHLPETVRALRETFPELAVHGGHVLDVGCAEGLESVALVQAGATAVTGIDIRIDPAMATQRAEELMTHAPITFQRMAVEHLQFPDRTFDAVLTMGSFEHFADPLAALREMARVVRPGGRIYLTSGVWRGPWGAHMQFFTHVPWVQYLFSERTIMSVRTRYRTDGAQHFHEVEGGLNTIGTRAFQRAVSALGLQLERLTPSPIFGQQWMTRLPMLHEFFTHVFTAVIRKP